MRGCTLTGINSKITSDGFDLHSSSRPEKIGYLFKGNQYIVHLCEFHAFPKVLNRSQISVHRKQQAYVSNSEAAKRQLKLEAN